MVSAPLDIVLSNYNVVQPDIMYFRQQSVRALRPRDYIRVPPDLAIEVLSPSTAQWDRGRKRDLWARFGLEELWIVDPREKRIELSVIGEKSYGEPVVFTSGRLESPTIEGFTLDVEPIFAELE